MSPKKKSQKAAPEKEAAGLAAAGSLLVGIGASAGGLEGIMAFIKAMKDYQCLSLFIVQHQSPQSGRDTLKRLLAEHTQCEVLVAEEGMEIRSGRIYIAPPGSIMTIKNGRLALAKRNSTIHDMIIDTFLRSLAQEAGERSVAVVLSGSNTDGTLGARAVKEKNGLVIAQSADSAAFRTMPESVITDGLADLALSPEEMPGHITAYLEKLPSIPQSPERADEDSPQDRDKLLLLLKKQVGHDFSRYKDNTVDRRIRRRMTVKQINRLGDYVDYVRENRSELENLFKDLLIGVTNFFRDPEAFEALKQHLMATCLPEIGDRCLRAWVSGCSTGEEAYSLAIILREAMDELNITAEVSIYATDLDADAIDKARRGRYQNNIEADVGPERLKRYFMQQDDSFQVKRAIREMVVFAVHNITQDPPFSRLDLVSCRNLLMYLKPEAQKRVLANFSYGLRPNGTLFLGTSEGVSALSKSFNTKDKKNRIFTLKPGLREFRPGHAEAPGFNYAQLAHGGTEFKQDTAQINFKTPAERFLLESCCPPSVLATWNGDILYYHGRTGRFLEPRQGPPANNILSMAREGLSFAISTSLATAAARDEQQVRRNVKVRTNGEEELVDVHVRPTHITECDQPCFMISFTTHPDKTGKFEAEAGAGLEEAAEARIKELTQDLLHTQEDMQAMIEEYEAANEELKASNEELQSTNEELRSTNEELETAKEELQSINEEQNTLNSELQHKNETLARVNDDMQNLLAGTRIATLFLDSKLRIRRFTESLKKIMNVRAQDEGRPVTDITTHFDSAILEKEAKEVLHDLNSRTIEVGTGGKHWYSMRVNPYRTLDNVIDGVVVTFYDITEQKEREHEAEEARLLAESVIDTVREPLVILDSEMRVISTNHTFYETFRTNVRQTEGKELLELGNGQWNIPELKRLLGKILPQEKEITDFVVEHDFPDIGPMRMVLNARAIQQSDENASLILLVISDIQSLPPK